MNYQGYKIIKTEENFKLISDIKNKLTVSPYVPLQFRKNVESFPVYYEDKESIIIPRYFASEFLNLEIKLKKSKMKSGFKFNGKLREQQQDIMNIVKKKIKKSKGGIVSLPCGMGKCLGKGTPILMYDGSLKNVEDICVGDKIMGDNSSERNVLSLVRGVDKCIK